MAELRTYTRGRWWRNPTTLTKVLLKSDYDWLAWQELGLNRQGQDLSEAKKVCAKINAKADELRQKYTPQQAAELRKRQGMLFAVQNRLNYVSKFVKGTNSNRRGRGRRRQGKLW